MNRFAVAAVGADRPGIVAAVTQVFMEKGCNLQDTAMTILGGCFAMMIVVDTPPGADAAELEAALAGPAATFGLILMVRPMAESPTKVSSGDDGAASAPTRCTVSVYGADHPGIVHGVADLLAKRNVNIVDLTTRVVGGSDNPVYAMVMEVELPAELEPDALAADLEELAEALGVSASLHPSEADIL